jgi:hypothetical protein
MAFTASYTANLAAFMIIREEYPDFRGVDDPRVCFKLIRFMNIIQNRILIILVGKSVQLQAIISVWNSEKWQH